MLHKPNLLPKSFGWQGHGEAHAPKQREWSYCWSNICGRFSFQTCSNIHYLYKVTVQMLLRHISSHCARVIRGLFTDKRTHSLDSHHRGQIRKHRSEHLMNQQDFFSYSSTNPHFGSCRFSDWNKQQLYTKSTVAFVLFSFQKTFLLNLLFMHMKLHNKYLANFT